MPHRLQARLVTLVFSELAWNCMSAVPDIVCLSCAAATPAPNPMAEPPLDAESDKVVGNPASDTCVVELMLPDDARVVADGVEHGTLRQLTFPHLEPQQARPMRLKIVYPGGAREERTILLRGGTLIRLSRSGPEGPRFAPVIQSGHFDEITAAAFSRDGRHLATGSQDGRTILWDVQTGKQLQTVHGFLSFRAPASRMTEGIATDTRVLEMQGCHYVSYVCFSPDGRRLLSICVPQPDFDCRTTASWFTL